jgi:hypothetical protein
MISKKNLMKVIFIRYILIENDNKFYKKNTTFLFQNLILVLHIILTSVLKLKFRVHLNSTTQYIWLN